ncbi:MAG TPA: ABC transporter ATP-binding protein [Deltaproteobacteria bacterium]|nr:ABC transporter ATP-binding protein [Deltaproteobacteria bacterium]
MIELSGVSKIYNQGRANEVRALTNIDLVVEQGSMVCLKGPSGSGKSTLLAIIGCIFPPTSGRAAIADRQLARLPDRFLTLHRRETIGFIFQRFNVLPELTVLDNITLPLLPLGVPPKERKERAQQLMARFGISHRAEFPAGQISGGELQRVAIARALINNQPIILADEPTAHLDTVLSWEFMEIMQQLQAAGKTIVIASHDPLVFEHPAVERTVTIKDGRLHAS